MKTKGRIRLLAIAAAAVGMAACGGQKSGNSDTSEPVEAEVEVMSPFVRINVDTTMSIVSIRDNATEKNMPNKLFYGETDSAEVEQLSPQGSVPSSISCFIIEAEGKRALFDTGVGTENGGMLEERLNALNIAADSIDYLFITHFHNDHIGGMTNDGKAVFTRAEVYVPAAEYDYWVTDGDADGKAAKAMKAYDGRLHRFAYTDKLPMGIVPMAAPGHTPGHTVFRVGRVLIVGDLFHGLSLQMQNLNLCPDYDMNRQQAIESRKKIVEYARENGLLTAGMHYFGNGLFDFKIDEGLYGQGD